MLTLSQREYSVLKAMLSQWGLPYLWGGKGFPAEPYNGRDCSGFVTWALVTAGGPDLRDTHNADKMWDEWSPTDLIRPGTVALYGIDSRRVTHVMASLWDGCVIGAAGGGRMTTTQAEARRVGARVQAWRSHLAMRSTPFLGWRRMPWVDENESTTNTQGAPK